VATASHQKQSRQSGSSNCQRDLPGFHKSIPHVNRLLSLRQAQGFGSPLRAQTRFASVFAGCRECTVTLKARIVHLSTPASEWPAAV
jgi:hypothetical protein